jgi:deoxyribonuclease-4
MKRQPAESFAIATVRLREVADTVLKEKLAVTLRPETMGKSASLGTLDDAISWSKEFENVLPCVDFAHLHARAGDGTFNSYAEFTEALNKIKAGLGERGIKSMHIHFSGIAYTAKGEKNHLNLADADIKYKDLFKALADMGVSGRVLSETPNMEEDAVLMQNTFQRSYKKVLR